MDLQKLMHELENINTSIFRYQLEKNMSLSSLGIMYRKLLELRENLLDISFLGLEINELEQVRFCLIEATIMVKIFIKEKSGHNINVEELRLKQLYKAELLTCTA